jgi:glucose-1-phosphate cytidylyltransferase
MASSDLLPPAMILCGGQGTRLRDVTEILPKPMVPVGPHPIVWHIMKTYAAFGVRRFILCLGYKREHFIDYFLNYHARASDVTLTLGTNTKITYHDRHGEEDWEVTLADTGDRTMTGGRVFRAAKYLKPGDEHFFLTYGDGLANVDVAKLLAFHHRHGKQISVTAVHPSGRFGELEIARDQVTSFQEKPQTESGLINGGFMAVRRSFVSRYLSADPMTILEQEPLKKAVAEGEMAGFVHEGFWQCMDTAREHQFLNQLWDSGNAPWKERW